MKRQRRYHSKRMVRAARILLAILCAMLIIGTAVLGRHGIEAQQTTKEQPQDLVIEIPEPATEGTVTVYTPDGAQLVYFGKIHIINDGKNGSQINISLDGWLVGKYLDGVAEYTE